MTKDKKSYYAVIPANIRYDESLPPNAKLLYGEITALCNAEGYCWASNKYFADLYGVSVSSIKRWLNALIDGGYITSQLAYKEDSSEIDTRYIQICTEGRFKNEPGWVQNCTGGRFKNEPENNTDINNTSNIKEIYKENANTPLTKLLTPLNKNANTPLNKIVKENNTDINNTVNKKEIYKEKSDKPTRTRFIPPTVEEVQAYCKERNNDVDAERFVNYYTSKGWKVGGDKMQDWKSAVRNWEKNNIEKSKKSYLRGKTGDSTFNAEEFSKWEFENTYGKRTDKQRKEDEK